MLNTPITTLRQFIDEFRIICDDSWGDAMDAWFECAGRLYKRKAPLPDEWEYKPGLGSPCEKDSPFHDAFSKSRTRVLREIGRFLYRYLRYLQSKGLDY